VERLVEPGYRDLRFEGVFLSAERVAVDGDVDEPERVDPVVLRVPRTDDETRAGGEYGLAARDVLADLLVDPLGGSAARWSSTPPPGMRSTSQSGTVPASRTSTTSAGSPWAAAVLDGGGVFGHAPWTAMTPACMGTGRWGTGKKGALRAGDAER